MENQHSQNPAQFVNELSSKQPSKKYNTQLQHKPAAEYKFEEAFDDMDVDFLFNNVKHMPKKFIGSGEDVCLEF